MTRPHGSGRAAASLRPGPRGRSGRPIAVLAASTVAVVGLGACSAHGSQSGSAPGSATPSYRGAVPIPTAPATDSTPTASIRHLQVLAMGAPVVAAFGSGADATLTALGPEQKYRVPTGAPGSPQHTPAVITLVVAPRHGRITIAASDLSVRDDTGAMIGLSPTGARRVVASPGRPARLAVSGLFTSGSAALTLRHAGRALALWDFTIELD